MNIIIKKKKLENPGIDPGASRIQIERSTTLTNPRFALNLFTNIFVISSWVAISNEYIYKETNITLVYWFYWPIFSLFPRALHLKMNIIIKKQKLENPGIDPGASRMQIERSTIWANPLVHWFYSPIFSLFPRALQLEMNIIIKKQKLENPGIDPGASRMQIERSTTWANPPCALILFTNLFIISSWVAISNNYN